MAEPHPEDEQPNDEAPEARRESGAMGFLEHLDELRKTVIRCVLALLIAFVLVLVGLGAVIDYLQYPFQQAAADHPDLKLVTNSPLGVFTMVFQVAFLASFSLALPPILYFIAQFVAPALVEREKRLIRPVVLAIFALFLLGAAFAYFLIVPATLRFSILLNERFGYAIVWTVDSYFSMLMWLVIAMGGSFQFPLVLLLLVRIGILSAAKLASWRRIAVVVIFILAAIITPTPDPMTQCMVALPLCLLYEISIWLARAIERRATAEEAE
jgi:sec-independent protein translocase protein TatC